jgi:hypothetical protein
MYEYWATVVSVHDGDSITVDIDQAINCCRLGVFWRALVSVSDTVAVVGWAKTKPVRRCLTSAAADETRKITGTGSASETRPATVERTWRPGKTRACLWLRSVKRQPRTAQADKTGKRPAATLDYQTRAH